MTQTYLSAASFRQSLEQRLQTIAKDSGVDLQRIRTKVAFERFLARLFMGPLCPWVLKGEYALEVRFETSRATKDLDLGTRLNIAGTQQQQLEILLSKLQEKSLEQINDHFLFQIEPTAKVIESAPYGGFRFLVRSLVAGRLFVAFSLDIGFGDVITPPTDQVVGVDWLNFCGIPPAQFEVISIEQQFAEKIHTIIVGKGERENSRVKDFVDVALLIEAGLDKQQLLKSITNTFQCRDNEPLPSNLPVPPYSWKQPFMQLAAECGLSSGFEATFANLQSYWSELFDKTERHF